MCKHTVNDLIKVFTFGENYANENQYSNQEIRELDFLLVPIKGDGLDILLI